MSHPTPDHFGIKPRDNETSPDERGDALEGGASEPGDFDAKTPEAQAPPDRPQTGAPNPFDPARYRLDQDNFSDLGITEEVAHVPVTAPRPDWWVRTHASEEYHLTMGLVEMKTQRELYLVDKDLWPRLRTEPLFHYRALYLGVNTECQPFIWPVRLPDSGGRQQPWVTIPCQAVELAKTNWIRIFWDPETRQHKIRKTDGDYAEPKWPRLSFSELLAIAFKDRIISDVDHPVLQKLLRGRPAND
jgi:hypothetical protein